MPHIYLSPSPALNRKHLTNSPGVYKIIYGIKSLYAVIRKL